MKKLQFAVVAALSLLTACNDASKTDTTAATTATDSIKSMPDTTRTTVKDTAATTKTTMAPADKTTTDFVQFAAEANLNEVAIGSAAQQKAKGDRVKNFAGMMVMHHTQANSDLKAIASAKGITVPAAIKPEVQKKIDDLNKKSGADFDKAYMGMMVDGHKKVLAEYKKGSTDVKDADVSAYISKTIPVVQQHLDSATAISGKK